MVEGFAVSPYFVISKKIG